MKAKPKSAVVHGDQNKKILLSYFEFTPCTKLNNKTFSCYFFTLLTL